MIDLILTAEYAPFTIALGVMVGIGLIEALGLGLGHLDLQADIDAEAGLLDWLGIGRDLPILVWLTSLLACFAICGFAIQQLVTGWLGAPFHWALASGIALPVAGLANAFVSSGLARIFPGFESTAIDSNELLRMRCIVLEGAASRARPARAKVVDQFGQAHYVMIEPHQDGDVIAQGEVALLVRKEGQIFFAIPDVNPRLRSI